MNKKDEQNKTIDAESSANSRLTSFFVKTNTQFDYIALKYRGDILPAYTHHQLTTSMQFRELINHLPILVYGLEYDPRLGPQTGRITYCNISVSDFVGYTESEIVSMGFNFYREVLHPDDLFKTSLTMSIFINADVDVDEHTEFYRSKGKYSEDYTLLKGVARIVRPIIKNKPLQFIVTTFFANQEETAQFHRELNNTENYLKTLTEREKEIAIRIAKGEIDKQIAEGLHISTLTVKTHRSNIRKKLQVKNTAEMVSYLLPRM